MKEHRGIDQLSNGFKSQIRFKAQTAVYLDSPYAILSKEWSGKVMKL